MNAVNAIIKLIECVVRARDIVFCIDGKVQRAIEVVVGDPTPAYV